MLAAENGAELMGVDIAKLERAGANMVFPRRGQAWVASIQRPPN